MKGCPMRCHVSLICFLALASAAWAQEPVKPGTEVTLDEAAQALAKAIEDAYPPPLVGRIKLKIEKVTALELLTAKKTKKPAGAEVTFDVMVTNSVEKDFDFSPGNIVVRILNEDGQEFPLTHYKWNESSHGDSGLYPVAQGKNAGKRVTLSFIDEAIGEDSKYFIVASYVVLYPKPVPKYDMITAAKIIEAKGAKLKVVEAKGAKPTKE